MRFLILLLGVAAWASACGSSEPELDEPVVDANESLTGTVKEGTTLAAGVLNVANSVSEQLLSTAVGLGLKRAASIVEHRNGPDHLAGTADDTPFKTLKQLDVVPLIGPASFDKLAAYAEKNGFVPFCAPEATKTCYTGAAATLGVGICAEGKRTCLPDGSAFGACVGEVLPVAEDCTTDADDNCDGAINENCSSNAVPQPGGFPNGWPTDEFAKSVTFKGILVGAGASAERAYAMLAQPVGPPPQCDAPADKPLKVECQISGEVDGGLIVNCSPPGNLPISKAPVQDTGLFSETANLLDGTRSFGGYLIDNGQAVLTGYDVRNQGGGYAYGWKCYQYWHLASPVLSAP